MSAINAKATGRYALEDELQTLQRVLLSSTEFQVDLLGMNDKQLEWTGLKGVSSVAAKVRSYAETLEKLSTKAEEEFIKKTVSEDPFCSVEKDVEHICFEWRRLSRSYEDAKKRLVELQSIRKEVGEALAQEEPSLSGLASLLLRLKGVGLGGSTPYRKVAQKLREYKTLIMGLVKDLEVDSSAEPAAEND